MIVPPETLPVASAPVAQAASRKRETEAPSSVPFALRTGVSSLETDPAEGELSAHPVKLPGGGGAEVGVLLGDANPGLNADSMAPVSPIGFSQACRTSEAPDMAPSHAARLKRKLVKIRLIQSTLY